MADYSDAKVYRIYVSGLEEYCYVGSTIIPLSDRLRAHCVSAKSDAKYKFASAPLFEEGNDPQIECLEEVECETKQELLARERYWIEQYPECLNKKDPLLDPVERHERAKATLLRCYYAKRGERLVKQRDYKANNIDKVKAQQKAKRATKVKCPICQKEMTYGALLNHKKSIHADLNPQTSPTQNG